MNPIVLSATALLLAAASRAQITNQDQCGDSGVDNVGPGTYAFDNSGATTGAEGQSEASCYAFGTSGLTNDVWLTYTAQSTGLATVETCAGGTNPDTKIAAWPGSPACPLDGTSLACNDDACGLLSRIQFNATAGASFVLQVGNFPSAQPGTGTLTIVETGTPRPYGRIGNNYCGPAIPNSTGDSASILAVGSELVERNFVLLIARELPPGQFGYFLGSRTQGMFQPPLSSGFICLGGMIGRYNRASQIGQGPLMSLLVTGVPVPTTPQQMIQAGDTWNWQCWYRDGATSNFTNAVSVTFAADPLPECALVPGVAVAVPCAPNPCPAGFDCIPLTVLIAGAPPVSINVCWDCTNVFCATLPGCDPFALWLVEPGPPGKPAVVFSTVDCHCP